MTEIEPYQPHVPATDNWVPVLASVGDLAQKIAGTQFVPKSMQRNPAAVAAAILLGREMGLGPMASLRGIDVIEGKPALTAQMLAARILAAGHSIEWIESTDSRCTVRVTRADGLSSAEVTWSRQDAERAGLWGKGAWRGYPRHMLRHRALGEAAGMACPDVALGLDAVDGAAEEPARPAGGTTVVQVARPAQGTAATLDSGDSDARLHPDPSTEPVAVEPGSQPDTAPAPAPEPEPISPAQMRKLRAVLADWNQLQGLTRDPDRDRDLIGSLIGRPLESAKDLTKAEATTAIDALADLVRTVTDPQPQQEEQR